MHTLVFIVLTPFPISGAFTSRNRPFDALFLESSGSVHKLSVG